MFVWTLVIVQFVAILILVMMVLYYKEEYDGIKRTVLPATATPVYEEFPNLPRYNWDLLAEMDELVDRLEAVEEDAKIKVEEDQKPRMDVAIRRKKRFVVDDEI